MMQARADESKAVDAVPESAPIIVDIGKKRKKQIKQLREGRGKLIEEIDSVIEELRTAGSISASAVPVVVVVQEKRKARSLMWPLV